MSLAWVASAATIPSGFQKRGDGYIKLGFDIQSAGHKNISPPGLSKRSGTDNLPLFQDSYFYKADIQVGSRNDAISVEIDTGSSDLWIIDTSAGVSTSAGTYDSSKSSTYQYVNNQFEIGYVDGSSATGNLVKDTVTLGSGSGGPVLKNQEFGDVTSTSLGQGIFGIGFPSLEAGHQNSNAAIYTNIPANLKAQGYIQKNAYSLYLDGVGDSSGTVLFGGIDHDKYSGDLVTLPVTNSDRLNVDVDSFGVGNSNISDGTSYTLDSGSTNTWLPASALKSLADAAGAIYDSNIGAYVFSDCNSIPEVSVNFNGISITIPSTDVSKTLYSNNGNVLAQCGLLFFENNNYPTLGDNFLRHAYVVYDLDDREISLAQVVSSASENITPIS
ncbi:peptidase A1-like protein [Yamadazyma tenuis]|uniref:candidapepsin n=1 Tax=Candida tenuis (strain ATCC 10573 / BCRC 21748 / CBS 615 / JCM 9827 / NBRC 10315 / NRRL Y-1498 / VKM Y-70) TaxID=590646 RepID=G3B0H3_CANTC|nr:peptidase A1 [Yamadazyma tenuis ATCC 10573]EGV65402.1 peptidase A1 [Yamadazyma tenuis ATCC 10573]WEJ94930.1 peptidase A1-like protein [Yamadazyma tenuis]